MLKVFRGGAIVQAEQFIPTAEQRKDAQLRKIKRHAEAELADLKFDAIDYFMRGETYPVELQQHVDAVRDVIDAKPTDPLPTLPERPVIEATAEDVKLG